MLAFVGASASAQTRGGVPALPPPDGPVVINTDVVPRVRVVPIASGLSHPWGMAFRRNGDILVTERDKGTLRVIRDSQLLERQIPGVPEVFASRDRAGLLDIALHPDDDRVVYLTYTKAIEHEGEPAQTVALARGVLDGDALTEVHDIFVAKGLDDGIAASRLLFRPDGTLLMSVGGSYVFAQTGDYAQDPSTHFGKLLRLIDDGTTAHGNPFVGNPDYLPEIFSSSRQYIGDWVTDTPWLAAFGEAEVLWWPSIAPSGMAFYSGEHFPAWQGNLFVGSMMVGRMAHTGHLERIVFNADGEEIRREWLLAEFKQQIRDVRQGPDGYLYILTEEDDAVLLRLEPA